MESTYVVGIAGASAGGKSTISEILKSKLDHYRVKMIHMDEYYKEEAQRPRIKAMLGMKEYIDDNHPTALDLEQCYIDIVKAISENWDIVIVEGIFALWDEKICALLNLKIFVDCDSDERLSRRISRHLSFGQDLEEITQRYIQAVQPRQREFVEPTKWKADIILNGFLKSEIGVEIIIEWLKYTIDALEAHIGSNYQEY